MANLQIPAVKTVASEHQPVGFLQEDNGNYSTMRLMSFIAFGGYTLSKPEVKEVGNNLALIFPVAAFAPKAVQKFAEQKVPEL